MQFIRTFPKIHYIACSRSLRVTSSTRQLYRQIISCNRVYSTETLNFSQAQQSVTNLLEDPGNESKLKLYALYKQATEGRCNTDKPSFLDFVATAKWHAWKELGDMKQEKAKLEYVRFVEQLIKLYNTININPEILYTVQDYVATIRLNRPNKKNAITWNMYNQLGSYLAQANEDENVKFAVLTGTGDYYSAGNDLSNFTNIPPEGPKKMAEDGGRVLMKFVASFIDFNKPLIAVVNGSAVGIPVTTLGLCDVVYAKDTATFSTPFAALGQSPEACSSYTFPLIMGSARASEFLLFGTKLTSAEAAERGLISEVIPSEHFDETIANKIKNYSELPPNALREAKTIIRDSNRETLHMVNKNECDLLVELWQSDECMTAILNFFQRKR